MKDSGRKIVKKSGNTSESGRDIRILREKLAITKSLLMIAEIKAEKNEDIYNKIFKTSPDAIIQSRLSDGMFVSVNDGFTRMLGYSADEVTGKTSTDLSIWKDGRARKSLVRRLVKNGRIDNFEAEFVTKDRIIVTGLMSASLIELDGIQHIISITKDITERKRLEAEINKEHFLMNALMDNFTDAVYFKDRESRFVRISKSNISKFGISDTSEAIGKTDFDFFSEEHARQAYNDEQEIIRTGKILKLEEKETHKNRADTWASTVKMPLRDQDGEIIGTFGISRDITSKKKAELEKQVIFEITAGLVGTSNLDEFLSLVHRMLSTIVYTENIFVALYDYEKHIFSFPYFVDKYDKIPEPTAMEKSCTSYVFKTERPLLLTQELFDSLAERREVELVGVSSPSWIGIPLRTPSKITGVLVLQHYEKENVYSLEDVNFLIAVSSQIAIAIERRKAEEEIREMNELLKQTNAEKDKFFSIIAHDLRSPLGSFVEATKLITEQRSALSKDEIVELVSSMEKEASSVYNLLENLLQWSRFRRGTMEFSPTVFPLKGQVLIAIEPLVEVAVTKRVDVVIELADDFTFYADFNMFNVIMRNLVSNAIKFTPPGGEVRIIAYQDKSKTRWVSVKDNGIGMEASLIKKLFLLAEKTGRPGTNGEPSTGLGLHLCKEFIDRHGGTVIVESIPGKGSNFSFHL